MSSHKETFDLEIMDEWQETNAIKGLKRDKRAAKQKTRKEKKAQAAPAAAQLAEDRQGEGEFAYSYHASRHESGWLDDSLGGFYEQHWITDVLRLIKGGKEASVYQCRADASTGEDYFAAKVYRPRQFRNLKNDHLYREGRQNLDENGHWLHDARASYAIEKKSAFGKKLSHVSWIEHEIRTMKLLKEAGADVPAAFAGGSNAILMTYFGSPETAAPALNEISLPPASARRVFERVIANIEIMLQAGRVHADLSAYNILYWEEQIMLIDFPQAIDPRQNRNAWRIFERDVMRVCQYFQRQGVKVEAAALARDLWKKQKLETMPELDPHFLDPDDESDRDLWQRLQSEG